jgi:hypothetical protein
MNKTGQLLVGWRIYADDNRDVFPPNEPFQPGWVSGWMDFNPGNTDNANLSFLLEERYAKLAPYTRVGQQVLPPGQIAMTLMTGPMLSTLPSTVAGMVMATAAGSSGAACSERNMSPATRASLTGRPGPRSKARKSLSNLPANPSTMN